MRHLALLLLVLALGACGRVGPPVRPKPTGPPPARAGAQAEPQAEPQSEPQSEPSEEKKK